jgi:hypothetical protein
MAAPSVTELQQMARETFGRELSEAEALACRVRLPVMVRNIERLRAFERALRDAAPAQVQLVLEAREDG